jgi:hypothetical protein
VRRDLPDELDQFIKRYVENVGHLEVLLLLRRAPGRVWRPVEVTRELRSKQHSVDRWLALLVEQGLILREGGGYRYSPSSELQRAVDLLAQVYESRPALVIEKIHSKPNPQLLDFVRAFEIRKKT